MQAVSFDCGKGFQLSASQQGSETLHHRRRSFFTLHLVEGWDDWMTHALSIQTGVICH